MNINVLRIKLLEDYRKRKLIKIKMREKVFFSSPQPVKSGKLLNASPEYMRNFKKTGKNLPGLEIASENKTSTPPFIKKMAKFWEKVSSIKNKFPEFDPLINSSTKTKESPSLPTLKQRQPGIPARFKEQPICKSKSGTIGKPLKLIESDLQIIKINNGSDITERLKIAKLVKNYENSNKAGILKRKNIGDTWRWFTPKSNSSERAVHFDLNT